jgi:squalene-hopene/tetraprenyl-beta-curcumene cyclase
MKTLMIALTALGLLAPPQDDLKKNLVGAYSRAADWLVSQQDDKGAWKAGPAGKEQPSIAYTGLIVAALAEAPADLRAKYKAAIDKGVGFIVSKQNADGSFGEGPAGGYYKVYTTSISLMALSLASPDKKDAIGNARGYIKNNQLKEGPDKGSLGYGDKEPKFENGKLVEKSSIPNLSTTGFAAEGMARSGLPKDDQFWKLVIEYVQKCQNNSETNNDPQFIARLKEKGLSVGDDGGLFYAADPADTKAGTVKLTDKTIIQSYGSMTYDGIKTYLYSGLPKDDPRVKAALDWVRKNYSVEAHPGFAFDVKTRTHIMGLFYYYLLMARAFDALGEKTFTTFDGKVHKWANELGEQLLKVQKDEKMWVNENMRWQEDSPVLVTSYVLNVLNAVMKYVD